jgi:hypothetical protein
MMVMAQVSNYLKRLLYGWRCLSELPQEIHFAEWGDQLEYRIESVSAKIENPPLDR